MSRTCKPAQPKSSKTRSQKTRGFQAGYERASTFASKGKHLQAEKLYEEILESAPHARDRALVLNDLAALQVLRGDLAGARDRLEKALALDPTCHSAKSNLELLEPELAPVERPVCVPRPTPPSQLQEPEPPIKVAILSLLFNWPSTGGGNVHTYELAWFLAAAGYYVRHIYARYRPWGIGAVDGRLPYSFRELAFDETNWAPREVQSRFRAAVDELQPDYVLITDSWNCKPLLAEAVRGYPYILRFQAMECICPLNNVRLLPQSDGRVGQCQLNQLDHSTACAGCVQKLGHRSGSLHQAERAFSGFGTPEYQLVLLRSLREAEAVMVVNPLTAALIGPHAENVRVVTAGMDPARFPWPSPPVKKATDKVLLFFAGLVDEWMKGFHVLQEACAALWQKRQDFELVATGEPLGREEPFTSFVGWLSQGDLPEHLRSADILVMPTVAQEALGRTAVEAMAAGKPVIASRIGGLPFTVVDAVTGLLVEPGDPVDLAAKIETLLEDHSLRERMGLAGRRRFEERYSWPAIIERHYRPVLSQRVSRIGL
jgi:glycosyltransferase involved in cell wall biosynthesis